jgi:chorismate mutase/prephenate dehydrogenase
MPPDENVVDGIVVGVVGGAGQMGCWLRSFWESRGARVVWSDRHTALSNQDVVETAAITFVAVPLGQTPAVLRALLPYTGEQRCLVSIASLMEPSAHELAAARGEALCAHPVFGPTVRATQNLPVVLAPIHGDSWQQWLTSVFRAAGMRVRQSSPAEHDASMAIVQALLHSTFVAFCGAMSESGFPPSTAIEWASPTMKLELGLAARILSQDPSLYADLVVLNQHAPAQLDALADHLHRLAAIARSGDREAFVDAFKSARASFGDKLDDLADRAETALVHLP